MKVVLLFLCFWSIHSASGQRFFTDQEFYGIILKNHPLAKQAGLKPMMGESQILKAQGGFDPKFFSDYSEKTYNSTTNFQKLNAGVTIPTWYGIQLKSGYEAVSGPFFNPESKTPSGGLFYGGISVTLGQGLMMDQRRAELFKARIYEESTQFEKQMLLNELVYESGYAYWNWFLAHHSLLVMENSYELALTRLAAVKISSEGGDRPMIDTVEARIQVQARQSLLVNFQNELANSRVLVSNYLWDESLRPLSLLDESTPIELETIAIKLVDILSVEDLDSLVETHPYLQMNNLKVKSLQVEQKLKREQLKPQLNLNYNMINEPINNNPFYAISPNNNKFGLQFEMPLLLRKERGELELAKLKVQDEQLNLTNNFVYLKSKIIQSMNNLTNAQTQVTIFEQSVLDTKTLFDAEKSMFESGESSLFLVNAREMSYIQAKLKYIEAVTKYQQAFLAFQFSLAKLI